MKTDPEHSFNAVLRDDILTRIAPLGREVAYEDGRRMHQRHDRASHMGVVLDGSVVLSNLGRTGKRITTGVLKRGQFYGVYPTLAAQLRTHDAHAHGATRVATFTSAAMRKVMSDDAEFREEFVLLLSGAIDQVMQALDDQRRLPLKVRVAKLLLRHSRNPEGRVQSTQADLAQQLGVSRNAFVTCLTELTGEKLVAPGYKCIEVPDRMSLRNWVNENVELAGPE